VWSSDGNLCGVSLVDAGAWMLRGVDDSDVGAAVELFLFTATEARRTVRVSTPVVSCTSAIIPSIVWSGLLPRDVMHSADYAVARCLSVCHTPVFCRNG